MAKKARSAASTSTLRTIKTSVMLDSHLHARLSALASLRGCTLSALLAEAAVEAARGVTLIDRRKSTVASIADHGDLSDEGIGGSEAA